MITTGILLKANEARLVTLTGNREDYAVADSDTNKLSIAKAPSQSDVAHFIQQLSSYLEQAGTQKLIVNRRATTGQGAGGAGTFILEGVILASVKVPVEFVHPATLRATDKRCSGLKVARPKTVDMGKAFDLAFEGLLAG
ncbi:DUF3010 family protein [Shewanella waksmanii]|uniref:DUF3010 family protein n=1 Tax=Shewanella waksmanii TaxID=213783 RepID=UPI003736F4E2